MAEEAEVKALASVAPANYKNDTERDYAEHLVLLRIAGAIYAWAYTSIRLRIGGKKGSPIFYTPDFMVILSDGQVEFHEVKGFWREAARVRIQAAAERYPFFKFVAISRVKGAWQFEEF